MTNDELKKKIAQIIADYFCPQRNEHKNLWGDDRLCYSKMNFAGCERVAECTDALITAGIGDTTNLTVENEVLQRDVDNLTRTMEEGAEELKEAEHRAEVAENALMNAVKIILYNCGANPNNTDYFYKRFLQESKKELEEGRKDEQSRKIFEVGGKSNPRF